MYDGAVWPESGTAVLELSGPQGRVAFWRRFEDVAASHPDVLRIISVACSLHLRGATRAMRDAVNRSVTTVQLQYDATLNDHDLATVFPAAGRLDVKGGYQLEAAGVASWLHHIMTCSPMLLQKIHHLHLFLFRTLESESAVRSVAELLSRCAPSTKQSSPHPRVRCVSLLSQLQRKMNRQRLEFIRCLPPRPAAITACAAPHRHGTCPA
jgi:hypothetical protein